MCICNIVHTIRSKKAFKLALAKRYNPNYHCGVALKHKNYLISRNLTRLKTHKKTHWLSNWLHQYSFK